MSALYLRNVPEEVLDRLRMLALRERMSVSSMAVRELTESTRRVRNLELLGELPDVGVSAADVLSALEDGRTEK